MREIDTITISIILIIGLSIVPAIQVGVYGQVQQQPQQQNNVGISQVIKHIAQQVAGTNPGTDPVHVQQILIQLARQTAAQTVDASTAIQAIKQIESYITSSPTGVVSQTLLYIAKQQAAGNTTLATQVIKQVAQQISRGIPVASALVEVAFRVDVKQLSTTVDPNKLAQQIFTTTGGNVTQIERVIQQIYTEISKTSGHYNATEAINQIASHVLRNPKGAPTLSILFFAQQLASNNIGPVSEAISKVGQIISQGESANRAIVQVGVQSVISVIPEASLLSALQVANEGTKQEHETNKQMINIIKVDEGDDAEEEENTTRRVIIRVENILLSEGKPFIPSLIAGILFYAPPPPIDQLSLTDYSPEDRAMALEILSPADLTKVLSNLPPDQLETILIDLSQDKLKEILNKISQDKLKEILGKLPSTSSNIIMKALNS